jgi:hypothetical protein
VRANGTVRPSAKPRTASRMWSPTLACGSLCDVDVEVCAVLMESGFSGGAVVAFLWNFLMTEANIVQAANKNSCFLRRLYMAMICGYEFVERLVFALLKKSYDGKRRYRDYILEACL